MLVLRDSMSASASLERLENLVSKYSASLKSSGSTLLINIGTLIIIG